MKFGRKTMIVACLGAATAIGGAAVLAQPVTSTFVPEAQTVRLSTTHKLDCAAKVDAFELAGSYLNPVDYSESGTANCTYLSREIPASATASLLSYEGEPLNDLVLASLADDYNMGKVRVLRSDSSACEVNLGMVIGMMRASGEEMFDGDMPLSDDQRCLVFQSADGYSAGLISLQQQTDAVYRIELTTNNVSPEGIEAMINAAASFHSNHMTGSAASDTLADAGGLQAAFGETGVRG